MQLSFLEMLLWLFSVNQIASFILLTPMHAKNSDGMPYSRGTATVFKFGDLRAVGVFLCSLANKLTCECVEIIPVELSKFFSGF